jgi:uroporphyrinogen decarboxylase
MLGASMNDIFLRACTRQPVARTPVWFMRQAGRYQPEYRELRERYGILEICRTPELTARVTRLPVEQLGVDAAILFSDIMVPVAAMGVDLRIEGGVGPVVDDPIRKAADVARLRPLQPDADVPFVLEAIHALAGELDVPLIGFAGAPFTLASYLIEGGPSRHHERTKTFLLAQSAAWHELMQRLADATGRYLQAQVEAGASAVQLFDSWVGCLSPTDYERHVLPHSARAIAMAREAGVPVIHFGTGTAGLLELMHSAEADVLGVDWRVRLDDVWARLRPGARLQGNLDPVALLGPREEAERRTFEVLEQAGGRPGHVFNLGHGVLPQTPVENVRAVVDAVHAWSARAAPVG